MEVEYNTLSTACKDIFLLIALVMELGTALGLPNSSSSNLHIRIHEDNVGAMALAKLEPGRMTPQSKHNAIKYDWFCELISKPEN